MRLSRERVQEFLSDWRGTAHCTKAVGATLPLQEELVKEIVASQQLHVDEASWMEMTTFLWLWVFSTESVTAYWIATRSSELIKNILGQAYCGWLMSDGYQVYRKYLNQVRCWAHLIRKAKGFCKRVWIRTKDSQLLGKKTLNLMGTLMTAIREAPTHPPNVPLPEQYQTQLLAYQYLCEKMKQLDHKKTKALGTEMLNNWEAIFQVLESPYLPLTNNDAERALRHWVILRRISYGTRTEKGSCVFALLISTIETCRKRQQSPRVFLASVIHSRRVGNAVPRQPFVKGSE